MPAKNDTRYRVVSTDDHVIEPADTWQTRLPKKLRSRGPRIETIGDQDVWIVNGVPSGGVGGLSAMAGKKFEEYTPKAGRYTDMRPGCYDAAARLADMDEDGVDAEVLFGSLVGFGGGTWVELAEDDAELSLACVKAYNDWLVDWCSADPARLVAQCLLPLWDPVLAEAELRRAIELGHRALLLPALTHLFGLPPLSDDRWEGVLRLCEDAGLPVVLHIAGSQARKQTAEMLGGALQEGAGVSGETLVATAPLTNYGILANIIFEGVPARYPELKIVSVESGIGWIPYFLERMDWTYTRHRFWTKSKLTEPPSMYFRRQMYGTFIVDDAGIAALDRIGEDNVMWEADYPHTDTTWPNSQVVIKEHLSHLAPEVFHKVVAGNAVRVFGLAPTEG